MKWEHEIFDHWWEYFQVAWWGISNPSEAVLTQRQKPTPEQLEQQYGERLESKSLANDQTLMQQFEGAVKGWVEDENNRKNLIETKAHSLLGQTSITVSLLIAAISFGASQSLNMPKDLQFIIFGVCLVAALQFIIAGLHARNAVAMKGFVADPCEELLDVGFTVKKRLLARLFQANYNSYLNDAKGSNLKFAHWYFKSGLVCLLIGVLVLPAAILLPNPQQKRPAETNNLTIVTKCDTTCPVSRDSLCAVKNLAKHKQPHQLPHSRKKF